MALASKVFETGHRERLSRHDRLRRVVLLCSSFARNMAYYRAGQRPNGLALLNRSHPRAGFWRQVNANFLDAAVIEWCKLLGDGKGKHYWRQVVTDQESFERGLLDKIGMTNTEFF
jgi:hypothetical protein